LHDLWSGARLGPTESVREIEVDAHGARVVATHSHRLG